MNSSPRCNDTFGLKDIRVGFLSFQTRATMVGLFELWGLVYYSVRFLVALRQATRTEGDQDYIGYKRWAATAELFWDIFPSFRCFSAIQMLRRIHPKLLPMELDSLYHRLEGSDAWHHACHITMFFLPRILILFFGFQAFVYKFVSLGDRVQEAESQLEQILISLGFMNQLVGGVVQVDFLMRRRLLLFLFGGEDAILDVEESEVLRAWLARLAQAIHTRHSHLYKLEMDLQPARRRGRSCRKLWHWFHWFVAIITWDHLDLSKVGAARGPRDS